MGRPIPFPTDVAEFDQDDRISYSREDGQYLLVEDGVEWEFNERLGRWYQPATEEQVAAFQQAYGGAADDDQSPPAAGGKRKQPPTAVEANNKKAKAQEKKAPENRAIYVTNLPKDTTADELENEFKMYGIIDESVDGNKRIKMYADDDGEFKGEALIVYFKKDSVNLAITMRDESAFRPGDTGSLIRVQEADMSYKKHQDGKEVKLVRRDRKANERNRAQLNRKLAEWSDDDEAAAETFAPKKNKWARFAIVKYAFTLAELEEDEKAILEIKEDMREEAEKHGEVTKVVLYDREPDGILSVRFKEAESAEAFARACNGRKFSETPLEVKVADDRPKFKKSGKGTASDAEEEARRLEKFMSDEDE